MFLKRIFNLLIFIFLSFFITACSVNNNQLQVNQKKIYEKEPITPQLKNEINQILQLIKQNNLALLNSKYIHPINGYYDVTKFEYKNIFEIKNSISELNNEIDSFEIKTEKVTFNCSPLDDSLYGWDKEGVFLNSQTTPFITKIMEEANILQTNRFKKEEIEKADFIEQTSYEVIIPYNIIFYITKLENNWYITLIDNVTTDCSR
ncbi:hypothetical protein CKA55_10400 [Arcobacter suis]|uniref:Lipoprotein n=1 Tax=Arcobacter suis CECT 7833 TaxID=663365 RepID=A0AAD0SNV2_9BACT|nr:hypothetical protein ASUIS_0157 [Arcobacter suis CECT 7833]RWS45939.1 hypothetical protein CKA55_10400 [Arcobacter suis]